MVSLPRPAGLVAVGAALTALVATATVLRPVARATPAAPAGADAAVARPVQGVTLVCPDVPPATSDLATTTLLATSRPGQGTALVSRLGDPTPPLRLDLQTPVQPVPLAAGAPLIIDATGPASGGLVVTRTTRGAGQTRDRGYSVDACSPARTDAWFVGASTAAGQSSALHLVNPDAGAAEVSIRALTGTGVVAPTLFTGVRIAPGATLDVPLEQVAPLEPSLAVEVLTTRGRVASSVREYRGVGAAKPGGVDAVPQALRPETTVTIAGVVGLAGTSIIKESRMRQVLSVGDPGTDDATVRIEVTDPNGSAVPVGLDAVAVPAGTVRRIDLTPFLLQERATVRVISADATPVVAGVLVDAQVHIGETHETLQLGATPPLLGPTIVPDTRAGKSLDTFLSFTSPDVATSAVVMVNGVPIPIAIPASRVVTYKAHVGSAAGGPISVLPAAGGPPIWVAEVTEELGYNGPLIGGASVSGGSADVTLPPAQADPSVPLVDARVPGSS